MGASGNTTVDFGAFPGSTAATVDVTAQTGFVTTSQVEAWLQPKATADHSADEHRAEEIKVFGTYLADGSIRVYAEWMPQRDTNGNGKPYGLWTIGWVWV